MLDLSWAPRSPSASKGPWGGSRVSWWWGTDLHRLVEVDGHHFLHAVLDHLGREEVGLTLLIHSDLAVVFQQDGADGLGGLGHVDGPIVAHHLTEVGECPTVVQVEVAAGAAPVSWMLPNLPPSNPTPIPLLTEGPLYIKHGPEHWRGRGQKGLRPKYLVTPPAGSYCGISFTFQKGTRRGSGQHESGCHLDGWSVRGWGGHSPDDHAVQKVGQSATAGDVGKVGEAPLWGEKRKCQDAACPGLR